ncbi:MAG: adenylate/guanylate cyclase domain-containing protein [Nitrosomonas sp.]|nr:adenylate/guanylate cyclase domain-containing protein [Nitrosomonas sp.]
MINTKPSLKMIDTVIDKTDESLFAPIVITSLKQNIWVTLEQNIAYLLQQLHCPRLLDSAVLLLHKLATNLVKTMHQQAFQQAIKHDLGIDADETTDELSKLLHEELNAHGDRNLENICKKNGFQVVITFPKEVNTLVAISYPACCENAAYLDKKLAEALGFILLKHAPSDTDPAHAVVCLMRNDTPVTQSLRTILPGYPELLDQTSEFNKLNAIFNRLSYGLIVFSSAGEVLSISPSLLQAIKLEATFAAIETFASVIPTHFYNDVIWGSVLESTNGTFENYRVRIKFSCSTDIFFVLFNVSGYRHADSSVRSLWQIVSLEQKFTDSLTEGSILNEARVHNITRNYVPQLVEQKAREVIRLGGNELTNEECFLAILFCDIVGFTTYVENNENEESVIHTLNSILGRISKIANQFGGHIDKFMGDCVMVLFRVPRNAVLCALEMQKHAVDINNMRMKAGKELLLLRAGIHWGKVVIGNVGTPGRLDWTAIGDVVNTAARLEKICRPGEVLISQELYDAIGSDNHDGIKYGSTFTINPRGKRRSQIVCYAQSATSQTQYSITTDAVSVSPK